MSVDSTIYQCKIKTLKNITYRNINVVIPSKASLGKYLMLFLENDLKEKKLTLN